MSPVFRVTILLGIVVLAVAISVWYERRHGGWEGWDGDWGGNDPDDSPPPAPAQPIPDFIPDSIVEEYTPTKAAA